MSGSFGKVTVSFDPYTKNKYGVDSNPQPLSICDVPVPKLMIIIHLIIIHLIIIHRNSDVHHYIHHNKYHKKY